MGDRTSQRIGGRMHGLHVACSCKASHLGHSITPRHYRSRLHHRSQGTGRILVRLHMLPVEEGTHEQEQACKGCIELSHGFLRIL